VPLKRKGKGSSSKAPVKKKKMGSTPYRHAQEDLHFEKVGESIVYILPIAPLTVRSPVYADVLEKAVQGLGKIVWTHIFHNYYCIPTLIL